jgi:hypothetical protein
LNTLPPPDAAELSAAEATTRGIAMKRFIFIAFAAAASQGCAKTSEHSPFHLGLPIVSESEAGEAELDAPQGQQPGLRHVASNKVLGAMAFQKITGRTVDPQRLQGSR